jgi:hypothetical protein
VRFAKEVDVTKRFDATFSLLVSLDDATLKDTIFSRPPIFFSLFLILDSIKNRITVGDLRNALGEMDARFEADRRTKADADELKATVLYISHRPAVQGLFQKRIALGRQKARK